MKDVVINGITHRLTIVSIEDQSSCRQCSLYNAEKHECHPDLEENHDCFAETGSMLSSYVYKIVTE